MLALFGLGFGMGGLEAFGVRTFPELGVPYFGVLII